MFLRNETSAKFVFVSYVSIFLCFNFDPNCVYCTDVSVRAANSREEIREIIDFSRCRRENKQSFKKNRARLPVHPRYQQSIKSSAKSSRWHPALSIIR